MGLYRQELPFKYIEALKKGVGHREIPNNVYVSSQSDMSDPLLIYMNKYYNILFIYLIFIVMIRVKLLSDRSFMYI